MDWLAGLRGEQVARESARLTERAMGGEIAIDAIYGKRLALIRPTRQEMDALALQYSQTVAPDAAATIAALRQASVRVVLVSGGFQRAIGPLASELGVELHAVDVYWNDAGEYIGFDTASPLTTQTGKRQIVRTLELNRPTLAVGDGSTDVGMRDVADEFAAFTGFVRRDAVVAAAQRELASFTELRRFVLGEKEE